MGITHHEHGVDNVQAIVNLALLRGMVGRPDAGLLPIRGHCNVQGMGSVGVTPKLKDAVLEQLQSHFGVQAADDAGPGHAGLHGSGRTAASCSSACAWAATSSAAIPTRRSPPRRWAKLDLVVYLSTTLNTGHAWGRGGETLILPVLARDEEPQPTTQESMFNFVRLSDGGPRRHEGPRSEVEIIADLAASVCRQASPVDWRRDGARQPHSRRDRQDRARPGEDSARSTARRKSSTSPAATFTRRCFRRRRQGAVVRT